ncbi:hypothetical protein F4861DRAFT_542781 [Xylaria intraflava]|nr:hypothetical protein F4861DRAFT_542781 [Xylaria intraflava]
MTSFSMFLDSTEHDDLLFDIALPHALLENAEIDPHDLINGNFFEFAEAIDDVLNDFNDIDSDNPPSDVTSSIPSGISTPLDFSNPNINPTPLPSADHFEAHGLNFSEEDQTQDLTSDVPEIVVNQASDSDNELVISGKFIPFLAIFLFTNFEDTEPSTSATSSSRLDISSIPENIDEIRQMMFAPTGKLRFTTEEFEFNWKFCNNIWTTSNSAYRQKSGVIRQNYRCVLYHKKSRVHEKPSTGQRAKKSRIPTGCPASVTKLTHLDGTVIFRRASKHNHNHDLNRLYAIRRPKFFRQMAQQETQRGYSAAAIFQSMTGNEGRFEAVERVMKTIGGDFFTRRDVLNAQLAFRKEYPDPRRVGREFMPWLQMQQVMEHITSLSNEVETWYSK